MAEPVPGQGQGVGQPRQGTGGWPYCVCPKCGYSTEHARGTPCLQTACPKCGTRMMGSNTRGTVSLKEIADNVEEACLGIHRSYGDAGMRPDT